MAGANQLDEPCDRPGPLRSWTALLAVLAACLPALLLGIDQRLSTHTMENVALVTSQETWLRLHAGDRGAWLVSTNDGKPRLEKPPLLTWLNLMVWADLDPFTATPQQLTFRARCVTAALGLLTLAATFWMGHVLGGLRVAALAALVVGSTFFFERQARTASYDLHAVAWGTLAVAGGLWAMRPLGISGGGLAQRVIGWLVCGLGLAAAAMSKNPLPYLFSVPPLIAAIVLMSPSKRVDGAILTAVTLLSFVPAGAWYWHVFSVHQEVAEQALGREVVQPRAGDFQPVYYYLGLLGLVVPWTLWLIGGLIEPYKLPRRSPQRRAAMFAWFWFVFIFVVLSIPAAKQQRYILAAMPAAGLLIALFIREHQERARRAQPDRLFDNIAAGTWIALGLASVAATVFLAAPERVLAWLRRTGGEDQPVAAMPLSAAAIMLAAMLTVVVLGWRWHVRQPWRSTMAMGGWMLLLMSAYWRQEAAIPSPRIQPFVEEAARINDLIGKAPLWSYRFINMTDIGYEWKINEEFRFYLGRLVPRIARDDLESWAAERSATAYVLCRPNPDAAWRLTAAGLERIDMVMVDRDDHHELWRLRR